MQPSSKDEASPLPPQHVLDKKLDADRIASMADEGGLAGARMELHGYLPHDLEPTRPPEPRLRALIWGALGLAAGVAVALLIPRMHAQLGRATPRVM